LRRAAHYRGPNLTLWISPSEKDTGNAVLAKQFWIAADLFSANSDLESQGYCTTDLGLVFLRFSVVRALDHS